MKLSIMKVAIAVAVLIMPFVYLPQASAITILPRLPIRHYRAMADFIPIKLFAKMKFRHSPKQFACLDRIFTLESHWNRFAHNTTPVWMGGKKYFAGGIPQILGLSTKTSAYFQVNAGIHYINRRYGSNCAAWEHWEMWGSY